MAVGVVALELGSVARAGGHDHPAGAGHLDPVRAAAAVCLVKPSVVVPIHWGTLGVPYRRRPGVAGLRRPAEEFAALVRRDSPEVRVHIPALEVPIALS